jgi:hypothetical protein
MAWGFGEYRVVKFELCGVQLSRAARVAAGRELARLPYLRRVVLLGVSDEDGDDWHRMLPHIDVVP